ncbi:MAG: hypothetical protein CM15mV126_420 [uncultured marine virus]|nr:MAG: hypothetical protein CM15mV126_420 [uncultured marine virus]
MTPLLIYQEEDLTKFHKGLDPDITVITMNYRNAQEALQITQKGVKQH